MKFLHLSDLHIGRRLNEYSLMEEQKNILEQAANIVGEYECSAVLIAGDIYDRPSPPADAMALFDAFLSRISRLGKRVYMISGNHDSAERISYFSEIIRSSGVYTSEQFSGKLQSFEAGENITIHLMPFLKPASVRRFYPESNIKTYEDAVKTVIENSPLNTATFNILVCHQFITGGQTCESEEFAVGGLDNISCKVFENFDYVALGHLHRAQKCGRESVRYAGSPLKYSVSEENHKKTFTVVDVKGKGKVSITEIPVKFQHDVKTVSGNFNELMDSQYTEDYVRVILKDEIIPPDARISLRSVFPNMLRLCIENSKTRLETDVPFQEKADGRTAAELFCDFYAFQNNGATPDKRQLELVKKIFECLEEEE